MPCTGNGPASTSKALEGLAAATCLVPGSFDPGALRRKREFGGQVGLQRRGCVYSYQDVKDYSRVCLEGVPTRSFFRKYTQDSLIDGRGLRIFYSYLSFSCKTDSGLTAGSDPHTEASRTRVTLEADERRNK